MFLYLAACWTAHHSVMQQVKIFAVRKSHSRRPHGGAPASAYPGSVGAASFARPTASINRASICAISARSRFTFTPDSPRDNFIDAALQLPEVKTYWGFARFPVIRSAALEGLHIVDFGENRFVNPKRRRPTAFYLHRGI